MPDPLRARENIWVPFITGTLEANEDAVLIGHSSGAAAALRVAEKRKLRGMVLVAGYDSGARCSPQCCHGVARAPASRAEQL